MLGHFLMGVPFAYAWVQVLGYKAFGLSLERSWGRTQTTPIRPPWRWCLSATSCRGIAVYARKSRMSNIPHHAPSA